MGAERRGSRAIDTSRAHPARVYDYVLGGKDNYAADREYAEHVLRYAPDYVPLARANRNFMIRAVRHLAEQGIEQYVDLGTGIPTTPNVHEVARKTVPDARVVYVDNDPIVGMHSTALLATDSNVTNIQADIREPDTILGHPELRRLIDFGQPVGLLAIAVLHFLSDAEDPPGLVARYAEALPSGSRLVISVASGEGDQEAVAAARKAAEGGPITIVFRSAAEILRCFDGFALEEPGLVDVTTWRSDESAPPTQMLVMGGVGRKP